MPQETPSIRPKLSKPEDFLLALEEMSEDLDGLTESDLMSPQAFDLPAFLELTENLLDDLKDCMPKPIVPRAMLSEEISGYAMVADKLKTVFENSNFAKLEQFNNSTLFNKYTEVKIKLLLWIS